MPTTMRKLISLMFLNFVLGHAPVALAEPAGPTGSSAAIMGPDVPAAEDCTVTVEPDPGPPQLVGQQIVWIATAMNCGEVPIYQFSVAAGSRGRRHHPFRMVRDFSPDNTFRWTPMQEGVYDVKVSVKDGFDAEDSTSAVVADPVHSRVTGTEAVLTPTPNPLVALYSAPPCDHGTMLVRFRAADDSDDVPWMFTNTLPCVRGRSRNFLVAGMLPTTTYEMEHMTSDGSTSSPLSFTTGALPSLDFPQFTVRQDPGPDADLSQSMIFHNLVGGPHGNELNLNLLVTDLRGRVRWYYDSLQSGLVSSNGDGSLSPDGTVLLLGRDGSGTPGENVLREADLAGNSVRETNLDAINAQLTALGHDRIYGFTHEVQQLPNDTTVVLGVTERTFNVNGTSTNYIGTMIVVLDQNLQVVWAWDAFDYLDVSRGPILGEICHAGDPQPTCIVPEFPAFDWLHSNAVNWSPADSNLILSVRHQDWVIKIDYRGGRGDGHVIWRLGRDSDFTADSIDPYPWFSHQHNAHYLDDSTLVLFDNGNTRCVGNPDCHSRGQVWALDEKTLVATSLLNADLGNYSMALGAAQQLPNGNFVFTSGRQGQLPNLFGQSIEILPDGTKTYVLEVAAREYRSFRMSGLYGGIHP